MRTKTPSKGIKRGDTVKPTIEATEQIGTNWERAVVLKVLKHEVDGRKERTLVQVVYYHPSTGEPALDALHETWLEKVAA